MYTAASVWCLYTEALCLHELFTRIGHTAVMLVLRSSSSCSVTPAIQLLLQLRNCSMHVLGCLAAQ
jgi:hypothetical protein